MAWESEPSPNESEEIDLVEYSHQKGYYHLFCGGSLRLRTIGLCSLLIIGIILGVLLYLHVPQFFPSADTGIMSLHNHVQELLQQA